MKQEVPQGSILRPIFFFLIYINDLPNLASIGNKFLLYADNTSIIVTSTNLENFETKIDKINNKKFETNLHPPTANLTKFQKAVYYSAIKIF